MTKKAGAASPKRPPVDWEAVELQYRAGIRSLKDIGTEFGVSDAGIIKKAKVKGWTRDLSAKIKAKADAKVSAAAVSPEVSAQRTANEQSVVEANADLQFQVRMSHRRGLDKLRTVKEKLVAQIEQAVDNFVDLQEVIEMVRNPDENGMDKANDALRKAMGRSSVVDDLKKLSEIDERVRKGEREAFGLDNLPSDGAQDPMATFLAELSARGSRLPIGGAK
jgi:hypothetical protein